MITVQKALFLRKVPLFAGMPAREPVLFVRKKSAANAAPLMTSRLKSFFMKSSRSISIKLGFHANIYWQSGEYN